MVCLPPQQEETRMSTADLLQSCFPNFRKSNNTDGFNQQVQTTGFTADTQTALSAIIYRVSVSTVRSTQINSYQKKEFAAAGKGMTELTMQKKIDYSSSKYFGLQDQASLYNSQNWHKFSCSLSLIYRQVYAAVPGVTGSYR